MDEPTVSASGVGRAYHLYDRPQDRLRQLFTRRALYREFWALDGVSFALEKGAALGIIGRNGSGKSTLLELVAGTLEPTVGTVRVTGRVAPLLELGSGFNPEFTGRENVYLNGVILGLSRAEVARKFDEIAAFADIGEFIDRPVKTYSSGMAVRLAFAVIATLEPQVLIVDEVLSVGDVFFQQKCFARIRALLAGGTILVLASHDMAAVQHLCSAAILLDRGRVAWQGDPREAVSRYYASVGSTRPTQLLPVASTSAPTEGLPTLPREAVLAHSILRADGSRHGARGMEIVAACVTDAAGRQTLETSMLGTLTFHVLIRGRQPVAEPHTGIHLYDRVGNLVFAAGTRQWGHRLPPLGAGEELIVRFELTLTVQAGEYAFSLGASEPAAEDVNAGVVHDRHELLGPLAVRHPAGELLPFYGITQLPARVAHARPPAAAPSARSAGQP